MQSDCFFAIIIIYFYAHPAKWRQGDGSGKNEVCELYLKALEIQGFKSFPDKTVLTFGEDITAIVGPNGSGKSNISDAIRWVMGEQSTRTLRGGKMEDVIFGGTARRKQTGYAEVSLVLDNTAHIFDMDESEVMVTRRYYRSGESEYYINRRSVRLRDVNELFMDTGLGREGYSIIGQGRIDEILSVKSTDRREMFEEAAGISRFRHRKEEAERKLERTDENLLRINDKIDELELQVEPLREQSERAKRFLILRDELKGLEISVWLDTLERLRAGSIKLETDYKEAVRQKEAAERAVEECFGAAEALSAQMREKEVEADRLRFAIQGREATVRELESSIAVLKSSIQHNLENTARIQEELEQREGRQDSLSGQIAERSGRLAEIDGQLEGARREREEKDAAAQEALRSAGTLARELEELRGKESVKTADAHQAKALLSALAAAAQEVLDRDEAVRQELSRLDRRQEEAGAESSAAEKTLREARDERDAVKNVISGYTLRLDGRKKKAEQARERHVRLKMDENALTARIRMLTEMEKLHEGYSKAVKLVMGEVQRGTLHHIHGPVAGLLHVPDQYTVAIETALGGAMQNLVVDREEDGKAVIQYLKRRDGGRATILPLSSIRPGELREAESLSREPGFVGVADQLVQFDPRYRAVFSNLLGRVAVMEDLDAAIAAARRYGYRFRIVTLDGQVLNPGGSMTGGSASRSAGILSRANELERLNVQSAGLREQLEQAERALEETEREAKGAAYELESAQAQLREWEDAVLKAEAQVEHCRSVAASLKEQRENQRSELGQLQSRTGEIERDTQHARDRIRELEGEAAALKSEADGKARGQSDLQTRSLTLTQELSQLTAGLAALEAEREATARGLEELECLRRDLAGDQDQSRALIGDYQEKNEGFAREIGEKEGQLQELARFLPLVGGRCLEGPLPAVQQLAALLGGRLEQSWVLRAGRPPLGQLCPLEVRRRPVIGLHQHPKGEGFVPQGHLPGRGADASLHTVADGAPARAHVPLGKVRGSGGNGGAHLRLAHGAAGNITDAAVVALQHHGVYAGELDPIPAAPVQHHGNHRVMDLAHVQGVGQGNGRFQGAQLLHLKVGGVRHLVVGDLVQAQVGGGEAEPVLRQRDAHRHPGVGDDGQTAGLAPAGGLGLPGVAHQPGVHQIRQVLINGGQAQVQGLGQGLPGAELLGAVQVVVYVAAGLPPAFI